MGGKDRRCCYTDGDSEDLSLEQLQELAVLDPQVKKRDAGTSSTCNPPVQQPEKPVSPMPPNSRNQDNKNEHDSNISW